MPDRAGSDLMEELYREILLDHYRNPRNRGSMPAPSCSADGANPLCGDQIHLDVELDDGFVRRVEFTGTGCSISQASASMMTEYVQGRSVEAVEHAVDDFQSMMLHGEAPVDDFGDIEALIGVAKFPARVKCASLAWKTLREAIRRSGEHPGEGSGMVEPVTTDERSPGDE